MNAQRKKCHGNRKDQRFRKKYRAQGMKPENIEKKLARRKQIEKIKTSTKNNDSATNLNKRQREISIQELNTNHRLEKSTNSISMTQPLTKKEMIWTMIIMPINVLIIHSTILILAQMMKT